MTQPQETRVIKLIVPGMCPHCNKEIMICNKLITPNVEWILKPEDISNAKKTVLSEIEKVEFKDKEEKKYVTEWINNPETIFGPEEVNSILLQLLPKTVEKEDKKEDKK